MNEKIAALIKNKKSLEINSTQFMILIYILCMSPENKRISIPMGYMSDTLGMVRNTAQKAISDLVKRDILSREYQYDENTGTQISSLYQINEEAINV